jgi:hypothetical protein
VLLHNMREEIEHASMLLEWLRRRDADFDRHLRTYLFTEAPITAAEETATGGEADLEAPEPAEPEPAADVYPGLAREHLTLGSLKATGRGVFGREGDR